MTTIITTKKEEGNKNPPQFNKIKQNKKNTSFIAQIKNKYKLKSGVV